MNNAKPPQTPPLRAHVQAPGSDLMAKLRQAFGLHQQGRLGDAELIYREVLAKAPNHPDALHFLGVLETQRGRHEAGVALMDRAIAINPRNAAAQYNRANTLRDMGRSAEAIAAYDAALSINADNIKAWNNRGVVLQTLTRYDEAIASYDRALALKSDHLDAHTNRGNTLMELARHEEALAAYDRAVALAPNDVAALYGRGNALAKL